MNQEFKGNEKYSNLSYDLTYLTSNDSITLNFTYYDNEIRKIDSIGFIQHNRQLYSYAKKIFIEARKNTWKHRYSSKFLFDDLNLFFQEKKKFSVSVFYDDKKKQLEIKKRKWRKKIEILSKILYMINVNK